MGAKLAGEERGELGFVSGPTQPCSQIDQSDTAQGKVLREKGRSPRSTAETGKLMKLPGAIPCDVQRNTSTQSAGMLGEGLGN